MIQYPEKPHIYDNSCKQSRLQCNEKSLSNHTDSGHSDADV